MAERGVGLPDWGAAVAISGPGVRVTSVAGFDGDLRDFVMNFGGRIFGFETCLGVWIWCLDVCGSVRVCIASVCIEYCGSKQAFSILSCNIQTTSSTVHISPPPNPASQLSISVSIPTRKPA